MPNQSKPFKVETEPRGEIVQLYFGMGNWTESLKEATEQADGTGVYVRTVYYGPISKVDEEDSALTPSYVEELPDHSDHGIDRREVVREGLVELRNAMLTIPRFDETLLLSHAIWWLSDHDVPTPAPLPRELLTADPALMASPEGDVKGLQELRDEIDWVHNDNLNEPWEN